MSLSSTDSSMEVVRRNLTSSFDSVSDVKGDTMKVFCRIRPMLSRETDAGYEECIGVLNDEVVRAVVPESSVKFKSTGQEMYEDFKYSVAFGPQVGQFTFFQETITDIITEFVEGQNGLVFSYGITSSGKTYTLQGDESNPGLITLTCHLFFASIENQLLEEPSVRPDKFSDLVVMSAAEKSKQLQLKEELFRVCDQESSRTSEATGSKSFGMMLCDAFYDGFKFEDRQTTLPPEEMMAAQSALYLKDVVKKSAANQKGFVSVWVSFIEIYNEYIYDLLQPNILQRQKLSLAEDQNGDVYVKGAKEICVSNCEEALKLLELGRKNLRIASTKLNYQSSRSHCIYTLKVVRLFEHADETCGRINRISFCDLAGSERANKSHATGVRLKEAGYINNSLLVLGRCMVQLRLNQTAKEKKMIPYRESKLTRLFYHFFVGKGRAAMIANASPCELTFDETLNVLRFSALAKELTLNDTYVSMASNSIQSLSSQWDQLKSRRDSDCSFDTSAEMDESFAVLVKEKDEIIDKLLDLADGLKKNLKEEKQDKAELEIKLRQEIYEDYSQYSDQLLENQKKVYEEQLELMKYNRDKLHDNMVKFYKEKIRLLEEEYEDEDSFNESISEEKRLSLMEVDQKIASLEKKQDDLVEDSEFQRLVSETESLKSKLSEMEQKAAMVDDYSKEIENLKNEVKIYKEKEVAKTDSSDDTSKDVEQSNVDNYVNQINSLTDELQFLKTELEVTKEHLEQKSSKLEKSESDKESSKEQCNNLKSTIDEANQVLDQYKKELEALKLDQITKENELIALNEDKVNLEKELSTIREKLDVENAASLEILSKLEEASKTVDSQKTVIDDSQVKLKDLQGKLRDTVKSLEDIKSKCDVLTAEVCNYQEERAELMEKCATLENEVNQLKAGFVDQEESSAKAGDLEEIANQKLIIEDLTNKCNSLETDKVELAKKLDELAKLVVSHKRTIEELKIKCSSLETVKMELTAKLDGSTEAHAQKIEELENKYNGLETLRKELSEKCDESTLLVESQKQAIKEYDIKCNNLDTVNMKLNARLNEMTECQKQKNEEIRKKYNNLIELTQKLKKSANLIDGQKKAIEELETKCKSLEETLKLEQTSALDESTECQKHEIEELKNKYTNLETVRLELAVKLDEAAQLTENQKQAIEELNTECTNLKSELEVANSLLAGEKIKVEKLSHRVSSTESEISQLNENETKLLAQLNNVDEEQLTKTAESLKAQVELLEKQSLEYNSEKEKLHNQLKELQDKIVVSKEHLDSKSAECEALKKEARRAEKQNESSLSKLQKAEATAKKQVEDLKETVEATLEENATLQKELDELKEKLKSCSLHEEEIQDLRRQVKEKEASIEQLEKGIKDCQKVKKDNEAKLENQIILLKNQHTIEIEEVMHLKRSSEMEVKKLKSALNEIEKEKNEDDSSETKPDSSEPKSKRAKAGRKQKAPTSKEEVKDSDNTTKRRRPLHSKQVKPSVETEDALENEFKEDSKPTRGTRKRKSDEKDFEPVKRRNRRKINEDTSENMSPVQRAISFVGSKFRNVAQSISAPSPRMTRGRKKLFNNESATAANPTWKH